MKAGTKEGYASEQEQSIIVTKSNASMREWNGRYRDDQRAGLPGSSAETEEGSSSTQSSTGASAAVSRSTGEEEGEETVNTRHTEHHKACHGNTQCQECSNAALHDTGEGGEHPGKFSRCFAFSDRRTGGGKLRVRQVRDVWWTNGLRIRIRLVVLSNFHVENILIRVTD